MAALGVGGFVRVEHEGRLHDKLCGLPPAQIDLASERLRQTLAEYHRRQPASAGLTAAELDRHAGDTRTVVGEKALVA